MEDFKQIYGKKEKHDLWMAFQAHVREFFISHQFSQAETPTLVSSPGLEPYLEPFKTQLHSNGSVFIKYLPTSPEFHLKRLLVAGWKKVFEIKKCFRNGEFGRYHQPEFTMLEWYRVDEDLESLQKDVELLLRSSQEWAKRREVEQIAGSAISFIQFETMASLFQKVLDFHLFPHTSEEDLRQLLESLSINFKEDDEWDDLFFRAFLEKIEPYLKGQQGVFISNFPPSMAALAKIGADGWAQRFEFYCQGVEIANAFYELVDPDEQVKRFKKDLEIRKRLGKEPVPIDEDFIQALREGMPDSSGIALGLERLFMVIMGIDDMREFKIFPHY